MTFAYPHFLWLLPVLLAGGYALQAASRRIALRKLAKFGPPERQAAILCSLDVRAARKAFWAGIACLCLAALAIARPMLPPVAQEAKQTGVEFFLILDVSKSMLVRDVEPNRLEAVKASLADWIKTRGGDRIGLILMAGDAFVQAPLTHDLTVLRSVLEQSGPSAISKGGSHFAGAIEAAANALGKSGVRSKVAVLISDGGATEGQALEALQKARAGTGLVLHTVGVGTPAGGPVPVAPPRGKKEDFSKPPAGYVTDEYGVRATSRLDERSLRLLAAAGGGRYFPFEPGGDVWNRLYVQALQPLARQMEASSLKNYRDMFQIPLFLSLALLLWQCSISNRRKNPPRPRLAVTLPEEGKAPVASTMQNRTRNRAAMAAKLLLISLAFLQSGLAAENVLTPAEAEKWVKEGKAAEAAKVLWEAAQKNPQNYYLIYNFGIASYAVSNYADAVGAFSEAALSKDEKLHTMALTQLGNAQFRMGQALLKSGNPEGSIVSWENAVEYYESSIRERGDSASRHNLGVAKRELEAVLLERAAKALQAGSSAQQLGNRINHLTTALEKFEKAATLNPDNESTAVNVRGTSKLLSDALAEQARQNRAEAAGLAGDPKKEGPRNELNSRASKNYEKAVELAPENLPLAQEYAEFKKSVANGFSDTAESLLKKAMEAGSNRKREDNLNAEENLLKQSIERSEQALAFDPDNARAQGLLAQAQAELAKTLEDRGDLLKGQADEAMAKSAAKAKEAESATKPGQAESQKNEAANQAQFAATQYGRTVEDYQKALQLSPGDQDLPGKLADVEGKLADALTKAAEGEMTKAAASLAGKNAPSEPGADKIQDAIGHLEKAVAMLDQSEAVAPGKNNAEALGEKANAQLSAMRGALDKALGKDQPGKGDPQNAKGNGPTEGKPDGEKPANGEPTGMPQLGNPAAPLNFSDIRLNSSEKQGQFVDKTKKERIRDW